MNATQKNPYIGPRTFQKNESHLFFGREREARDLIALVASEQLVLFYAQSGAGKSSIVNTRLIPSLERKDYEVLPVGRVGGDVLAGEVNNIFVYNLIRGLVQQNADAEILKNLTLAQFLAGLNINADGYFYDTNPLEESVESSDEEGSTPGRRALIVDQFEELLSTHPEAWEKREDFFVQLAQAMQDDPYLWVILVMREDFIAMLDPYAHRVSSGLRVRYYMQRLGREAALSAVRSPVEDLRPYAEGVAETLVDNLARINIKLPDGTLDSQPGQYVETVQLQVVCYSLWENLSSERPQITEEDLREVGDVNQSLERFYDGRVSAVAKEKNVEERLIREWFDNELITMNGTRNMVLRNPKNDSGLDDKVIQALQGDLVRAEMRGGQTWYELSHDRLIEPVHLSNTKWFAANLSFFQQQAALWVAQDRSEGLLLRGKELELAELEQSKRVAESKTTPKDELDYLAASIRARDREKREKRGNIMLRIFAGGATVLLFAAIVLWFQAADQADRADKSKEDANVALTSAAISLIQAEDANKSLAEARGLVEADALAGQAQIALSQSDTIQLGRLLSVEAYNTNKPSGEILPSVYQALVNSISGESDLTLSTRPFSSADFSFDGDTKKMVVDNYLWNLNDIQVSRLDSDSNEIIHSSFLSNEKVVVISPNTDYYSAEWNPYNANIINIANQEIDQIQLLVPKDASSPNVHLSDNSRWIALTFSALPPTTQGGVLLWDAENPYQEPKEFLVKLPNVQDAAISRDGTSLAVVDEKNLSFWKDDKLDFYAASNILIPTFELDKGFTRGSFFGKSGRGLQYSPDGNWLALQTEKNIYFFDPKTEKFNSGTPPQDNKEIIGFLFSPDNKYVVYVVKDNQASSVFRWSLGGPDLKPYEIYKSTSVDITAMDISATGKLVIGDEAGYVREWDISQDSKDPLLVASVNSGKIVNILIGPDDQTVISASEVDGTRLFNLSESGSEAVIKYRIPSTVSSVVPITGEDSLVIGGINSETTNGTIHVYSNLQSPDALEDLPFESGSGSSLQALAVGSKWVAAGRSVYGFSYSYYLDFWERGSKSFVSFELPSEVGSLVFYPDGHYLVTAAKTGEIWIDDTEELSKLMTSSTAAPGNESPQTNLQMPHIIQLPNDLANIQSLLFTQNGRYLIGASTGGVRIWETSKFGQEVYYQLPNAIYPIMISPDQKMLVTAGFDNKVQLYDLENLSSSPLIIPVDKTPITRFAFNQNGDTLAVANRTGGISIYSLPVKYPFIPVYTLQGPSDEISWLEFSPAGLGVNWLVAGSGSSIYLWNMTSPNDKPITLQSNGNVVYVSFTNDGKWIITSSTDQTLQFWSMDLGKVSDTACKYAKRNLTQAEWKRYFPKKAVLEATCKKNGYNLEQEQTITQGGPTPTPFSTLSFVQAVPTSTTTPTPQGGFIEYTIQPGDLLAQIAFKFKVDINTIIADNNITNPNLIVPGQVLKIRTSATSFSP